MMMPHTSLGDSSDKPPGMGTKKPDLMQQTAAMDCQREYGEAVIVNVQPMPDCGNCAPCRARKMLGA